MTPNYFYQRYGQHIARTNTQFRISYWPYICPITNWPNNIVNLSQLHIPDDENRNINRFTYLGFDYPFGNISVVLDSSGKITSKSISRNSVAMSYNFSGCYMAKFCFAGCWFVCHIFCSGPKDSSDCKNTWNSFVKEYCHRRGDIDTLILFKPTNSKYNVDYWNDANKFPPQQIQIAGLITPDNRCYSLPIDRENAFVIDSPVEIQRIRDGIIR